MKDQKRYWEFRIRFNLNDGITLNSSESKIEVFPSGLPQRITLHAGEDGPISGSSRMKLYGAPFSSESEAWESALKSRSALLIWAVSHNIGIDLLDYDGTPGNAGGTYFHEGMGIHFREDKKGIDVYETSGEMGRLRGGDVNFSITKSTDVFAEAFRANYNKALSVDDRLRLACELYCVSFFDTSDRTRFITLVTCIEALLTPSQRSAGAVALVDEAIESATAAELDSEERKSLLSGFERLRKESIGSAGSRLASETLGSKPTFDGKTAGKFFKYCYRVRSEILHSGKPSSAEMDIANLTGNCYRFVGELLRTLLQANGTEP